MNETRSPIVAALFSTVAPGLGQLYNREVAKGAALLIAAVGIILSCIASTSSVTSVLMGIAYVAVWAPAIADAYHTAKGDAGPFLGDSLGYIVPMMLFIGPFGLPMLWQSKKLSKRAKILWTIGAILFALLFFTILVLGAQYVQLHQPS